MASRFEVARSTLGRDPAHLPLRDRAALRILNRAGAATSAHLDILVYRNYRVAQHRLRLLWCWGLLERATLPPAGSQAGAPYAYRPSRACLRRLGYRRPRWRGPGYLEHTLDAVDAVCALVASASHDERPIVQLWLPERLAADALGGEPIPDAIVVLATATGLGVVCLELDEATQHAAPIRAKLAAYQRALAARPGWHVLFVVPGAARAAWLRRVAAETDHGGISLWTAARDDLRLAGADAPITSLTGPAATSSLRAATVEAGPWRSREPVGSQAWIELLGTGGGEDVPAILT
jgi:hypothetical protein